MGKLSFIFRDEKGMAAIVAFSVLFILLTLGAIFLFSMDTEFKIATNQRDSTQALYIAEAGLERGIRKYLDDGIWSGELSENLANGKYRVTVEVIEGEPLFKSTGEVYSPTQKVWAKRKVQVKLVSSGEYARYALLSGGDIGNTTATGQVKGTGAEDTCVHANGSCLIDPPDGRVTIQGVVTEGFPVDRPTVNMSEYENDAEVVYDSDHTFPTLSPPDYDKKAGKNITYKNKMFYVKGVATINTSSYNLTFSNCSLVAEGLDAEGNAIVIQGGNTLDFVRKSGYPAIVTKEGNIVESGSNKRQDRSIQGLIFSEQGTVHFDNITANPGRIIANSISFDGDIFIIYKPKFLPSGPSPIVGAESAADWQEIY